MSTSSTDKQVVTVKQNGREVEVEVKEIDISLVTADEVAKGLSDTEVKALAGKRQGLTDAETTAAMGIATVNQIGNYRRNAEAKLGLREPGTGRKGGNQVAIPSADDFFKSSLAAFEAKVQTAVKRVDTLQAEVDGFDPKTALASMKSELTTRVEALRAEADEIEARVKRPAKAWTDEIAAMQADLVKRVDTARETVTNAEAELAQARVGFEAALKAIAS